MRIEKAGTGLLPRRRSQLQRYIGLPTSVEEGKSEEDEVERA